MSFPQTSRPEFFVARCIATGLYFDGTNFSERNPSKAKQFDKETTAQTFALSWASPIEMIEAPHPEKPSYALRISRGEFDKYGAAKAYISEMCGFVDKVTKNSFSIRVDGGKYVGRKVYFGLSERPGQSAAYINLYGVKSAIVWSKGELAVDWV